MLENLGEINEMTFYKMLGEARPDDLSQLRNNYRCLGLGKFYKVKLSGEDVKRLVVCSHKDIRAPFEKYCGVGTNEYDKIRTLEKLLHLLEDRLQNFFVEPWFENVKRVYYNLNLEQFNKSFFIRDLSNNEPSFGSAYLEDGAHRLLGRALREGFSFKIEAYIATQNIGKYLRG